MKNEFIPEILEERIGYVFHDRSLLLSAVTHSSYTNELTINRFPHYERLEFLGDAVLELTVSDFLYRNYPDRREGELTRLRASLVCEPTLAAAARSIGLQEFILVGRGEETQNLREHDSIISDVFEAVIGAVYLDGGMECAAALIGKYILTEIEEKQRFYDAKTILQIRVQKQGGVPEYRIVNEAGPDHRKVYTAEVLIDGIPAAEGKGSSRKNAEQQAAYEALRKMGGQSDCRGNHCI